MFTHLKNLKSLTCFLSITQGSRFELHLFLCNFHCDFPSQVLWGGFVVDPEYNDPHTTAIRATNEHVSNDMRVDISMLNVGDGTTLVFKR